MAYPDIIGQLRPYLEALVDPLPVAGRVPDPRPDRWVQIRRVGGVREVPVRDRPRVDSLCWDVDDVAALDTADIVRRAITGLAGTMLLGVQCYRVEETLGPTQSDDPLTGRPRVLMTHSILIRADDAI